jgi:hypothetical protein
VDTWAIPGSAGIGAALKQMGWDEPSVPGRKPGEPFALSGSNQYGVGEPRWPMFGITPTEVKDAQYGANIAQQNYESRVAQQQAAMGGSTGAYSSGTSVGGDWSGVERWNALISQAASKYGVDPNLVKALMKLESNGDPNAAGSAGVWGPMQVNSNPDAWGYGPWSYDAAANIDKGVQILKYYLDANNGNMFEALRGYHGYGWDGKTTDDQYANIVMGNYNTLRAYGTTAGTGIGGGIPSGGTSNAIQSMFGTGTVPDWGEFGVESGNGLYDYGKLYGLSGTQHTGADVPMNVGTAYRAPMGGVVMCGGTGVGTDSGGGTCSSFNDYYGNGAGRVEVMLDNGAVLIYGHSSTSALRPGQRFTAGTVLGTSGGMNSPHIHLEARVRDASMPSGWRIVDPRSVLGGGSYGGSYGTPPAQTTQAAPSRFGFTNFWLNQYGR